MSSEFYKEASTLPVESETIVRGKSRKPFKELPSVAAVNQGQRQPTENKLMQIHSEVSGRALTEKASNLTTVWGGEYAADVFGARDQKGGVHNFAHLAWNYYEGVPSFTVKGLYSSTDVERLLTISEFMRSHGLPTENISHISELKEIVQNDTPVPLDKWRSSEKLFSLERILEEEKNGATDFENNAFEYIDTARFFLVERELQTSERLRDLSKCKTEEEFKKMLGPVLKWLNVATRVKGCGILPDTPIPDVFLIDKDEDVQRYLEEWIPAQMAVYLARMRKLKINDKYPHAQNWSLVATHYDLQGFTGEVIGTPCSEEDYDNALTTTLGALEELLDPFGHNNYISRKYTGAKTFAKINFIKAYLGELEKTLDDFGYEKFASSSFGDGDRHNTRVCDEEMWEFMLGRLRSSGVRGGNQSSLEIRDFYFKIVAEENKKIFGE